MKPIIKLYEYTTSIKLLALIDDYEACSWERNKYAKGQFSIEINYNIPNATKFRKGLIVQFGNDEKNVGIIRRIQKSIAEDGKGSEKLSITGYDLRDLFSQRIIENLNNNDTYTVSGSGETCIRSLVASQCGVNAAAKRRLPIVNGSSTGLGLDCSVSEAYSNLYDVLETIATQSLIGWGVKLVGNEFVLYFYEGIDRHNTVKFSVEFDSLSNGSFDDTDENKVNAVFIGGKGTGDNRDIYEVEDATSGETLSGLNRFEGFSNQSSLTEESEYLKAGTSILTESLQTLSFSGAGLEKCPYVYKDNYDVGDSITVSFSGTTAIVEIVSLSEHWSASGYDMDFDFGKPVADLQRQLKILLTQIRTAEATANSTTKSNVKYYTIPTDTEMPKADVILDVIGFTGDIGNTDKEFELYFDGSSKTGAKTYHVYFKNLTGSGKLKLKVGSSSLSFSGGTYVAIIYVDESGEVRNMGSLSDAVVSAQTSYSSEKINTELNKKLSLSGGTMTGKITMPLNQYGGNAPLHMNNSDIIGLNALYWGDHCEFGEGFNFPRSSGDVTDWLRVSDGQLKLGTSENDEKTIRAVKFADYTTGSMIFANAGAQQQIPLSNFGSDISADRVICFQTLYWTGLKVIADADWGSGSDGAGLACALTSFASGTLSYAIIRCVYLD